MRSNSAGFGSAYVVSFNQARPHQGLGQRIPKPPVPAPASLNQSNQVSAELVLGGFHHDDHRAAETGGVVFAEMSERYLTHDPEQTFRTNIRRGAKEWSTRVKS